MDLFNVEILLRFSNDQHGFEVIRVKGLSESGVNYVSDCARERKSCRINKPEEADIINFANPSIYNVNITWEKAK